MAEVGREQPCSPTPPVPPPPTRRPRVREVSSRFMSPVSSSSSSSSAGDLHLLGSKSPLHKQQQQQQQLHRSISVQRQRRHLEMESDENRISETARSLDSPFQLATQKKNQQRPAGKTLKDNIPGRAVRPDTPMLNSVDRMPFSRLRTNHRVTATATAAAKLLQSSGMSASSTVTQDGNQRNSGGDLDADMLPTVSGSNSLKFAASPFSRSLNSPLSTCEPSLFHSVKPLKTALPPVPPPAKLTIDTRKAKKISSHQEDVHSLKLLYNHYLQWRYANAKAETTMGAQKQNAQRTFYSLGLKMSDFYASVQRKRIELGFLQRTITLSTILEAQMRYLEDWSTLEGDYSLSLSDTIQALSSVSTRLPVSSNIKVDIGDVGEALNSAGKLTEAILLHIQNFVPKAEEVEKLISELARVTGGQRVEIQECGDLLSQTYALQVEECSLRSQFIQFHRSCTDILSNN